MDEASTAFHSGVAATTDNGFPRPSDNSQALDNGLPERAADNRSSSAAVDRRACPRATENGHAGAADHRSSSRPFRNNVCAFFSNITLEPVILLNGLATAMQAVIVQQLTQDQSCLTYYNATEEFCANVSDPAIGAQLKMTVSNYNLLRMVLETAPCVFLAMFLGSWSDKYGPKLLVLLPLVGDALSSALYGLLAYLRHLPPHFLLLASLLQGLTGGNLTFHLGVCCFIIGRSTLDTRTTAIAVTDVAFGIGVPVGRYLGGVLFARYGYVPVFSTAFLLNCSALFWALGRLSKVPHVKTVSKLKAAKDLFRLHNLKNCVRVLVKKREGRIRLYIGLILVCSVLVTFPRRGEAYIFFLFTQQKFNFSVNEFSTYEAFSTATTFVGTLIVLPILSYCIHINDIIIAIVAMIASIANDALIAFSTSRLMLYIAAQLLLLSASASVICRSLLTKCVDQDELGKLLALIGLFGAAVPIISGIFYTQIFNATLTSFPGTCYLMSASITILPALCFMWLYFRLRKMDEDPPEQQEIGQLTAE